MEEYKNYTYLYSNLRLDVRSGYDYGTEERLQTFEEALESLVRYELGYGGQVQEITSTRIVVRTRVFSKEDIVTFEATEEEMVPLLVALRMWMEASQKVTLNEWHSRLVERFGNEDGTIVPCFAAWGAAFARTDVVMGILRKG